MLIQTYCPFDPLTGLAGITRAEEELLQSENKDILLCIGKQDVLKKNPNQCTKNLKYTTSRAHINSL